MASKLFAHLRRQWIGTVALLLVVGGGTAVASHEEIFSDDIVNQEVRSADVANDTGAFALTGGDIANAVGGSDKVNADKLDDLDSTKFQRSGAGGFDTARAGTMPANDQDSFDVAEGRFRYACFTSNAGASWSGPAAEIWLDTGASDPQHFNTSGIGRAIENNAGDREQYVFATANRVAFVDLYSHATGSECHFAYQVSDYER
jgi:hypothetical protein